MYGLWYVGTCTSGEKVFPERMSVCSRSARPGKVLKSRICWSESGRSRLARTTSSLEALAADDCRRSRSSIRSGASLSNTITPSPGLRLLRRGCRLAPVPGCDTLAACERTVRCESWLGCVLPSGDSTNRYVRSLRMRRSMRALEARQWSINSTKLKVQLYRLSA
jgi:hypothetical protein